MVRYKKFGSFTALKNKKGKKGNSASKVDNRKDKAEDEDDFLDDEEEEDTEVDSDREENLEEETDEVSFCYLLLQLGISYLKKLLKSMDHNRLSRLQ